VHAVVLITQVEFGMANGVYCAFRGEQGVELRTQLTVGAEQQNIMVIFVSGLRLSYPS